MSLGKGLLYRSTYQYLQEYDLMCIIVKGQKWENKDGVSEWTGSTVDDLIISIAHSFEAFHSTRCILFLVCVSVYSVVVSLFICCLFNLRKHAHMIDPLEFQDSVAAQQHNFSTSHVSSYMFNFFFKKKSTSFQKGCIVKLQKTSSLPRDLFLIHFLLFLFLFTIISCLNFLVGFFSVGQMHCGRKAVIKSSPERCTHTSV